MCFETFCTKSIEILFSDANGTLISTLELPKRKKDILIRKFHLNDNSEVFSSSEKLKMSSA